MTIKIRVYSDYICPFCFLAKAPFEEAIKGKDVEVEWMPFELRPSPAPQIDPWNEPAKLQGWESYIKPTAEKWGVNMKLPHVSPHPYTHLAHEGYQFAKAHGLGNEYNQQVFIAFFQQEQNIGEIEVLTKIAGQVGLDEAEFRDALATGKYREVLQQEERHAYEEAQITAVPTFWIGEEKIQGAANKEVFEQVIQQEMMKKEGSIRAKGMACDLDEPNC